MEKRRWSLACVSGVVLLFACSDRPAPGDAALDRGRPDVSPDRPVPRDLPLEGAVVPDRGERDRLPADRPHAVDQKAGADGGSCKPYCGALGTKSEGWYDGCTKTLLHWDQCAGCEATCRQDPGGPGWYKVCSAQLLRYDLCAAGNDAGSGCKPYCGAVGTKSEGWYDGCTHQLMTGPAGGPFWAQCATCLVTCKAIGSKSEGWYGECPGTLIVLGACPWP